LKIAHSCGPCVLSGEEAFQVLSNMKKIIIAETIVGDIGGLDAFFKRGDITTYPAVTSEEILNIHGVRKADLIITDLALPLMGGAKLCSALRGNDGLKNVSIVMACDNTEASLAVCREARANAVLPKPVDPVQLFSKISELLVIPHRKDIRVLLRVSVKGREGDSSFFAASQDISISGMLLETDRALKKGDRLICSLNIGHSEVAPACEVTRVNKTASGRLRYGVKFLNPDTKSLIIIQQFVKINVRH
jgi:CheY-like chemotaxis protein